LPAAEKQIGNRQLAKGMLLGLLVTCVLATTATKLLKFKPIGRGFLILRSYIVTILAVGALKDNIIARHKPSLFP
jgi:hypothetical protein